MFGKAMVDLARTPAEVKEEIAKNSAPPSMPSAPLYGYGTCISFDEEDLAKLGIDELPAVGEMVHMVSMGKVTSVSENERENADGTKTKCCRCEIQLTHVAVENEDEEGPEDMARPNRSKRYQSEEAA